MTRFFDVSHGKIAQLERLLAEADLDGETLDELLRKPVLVNEWVSDLKSKLAPPALDLFRSPMTVFNAFQAQCIVRNWPFSQGQIDDLCRQVEAIEADGFQSSLNSVFSFDIWLGDLSTTFEELALWIKSVHPYWRLPGLKSGKKQLRLCGPVAKSGKYGKTSSVKPVVVDLNANRGKAPRDVRSADSAGLDVMAAFATHDQYPSQINYDTVPGVWLPSLEASLPGDIPWRDVPILDWSRGGHEVNLYTSWDEGGIPGYAVPVSKEL